MPNLKQCAGKYFTDWNNIIYKAFNLKQSKYVDDYIIMSK
jgi:hypothetical protein